MTTARTRSMRSPLVVASAAIGTVGCGSTQTPPPPQAPPTTDGWTIDGSLTIRGITKVIPLTFTFGGTAPSTPGKPDRVAFHAEGGTKRADFGMVHELASEIGASTAIDVTIEVDTEALAATN